jgi:hypothetical protein
MSIDDLGNYRHGHELDPGKVNGMKNLDDDDLLNLSRNPPPNERITVSDDGRIIQGDHRVNELKRRAADPNSSISGDDRIPVDRYKRDLSMFWDME